MSNHNDQLIDGELDYIINAFNGIVQKEENMALNYNDEKYQGNSVFLPKVGENATFTIKRLYEAKSDNPKFNFSINKKVQLRDEDNNVVEVDKREDLGYHIEAELDNGKILYVNSLSAFNNVFKKYQVNDGDTIKVSHPDRGEWVVEKVKE